MPGRDTGPGARVRILEDRLRRARAYLQEFQRRLPSAADIDFDALLGPTEDLAQSDTSAQESGGAEPSMQPRTTNEDNDKTVQLDSMMSSYGRMAIHDGERATGEFYGAASGLAFLHRTKDFFENRSESDDSDDDSTNSTHSAITQLFDSPFPQKQALSIHVPVWQLLPHRETTQGLLRVVFTQVYPLFNFLDEKSFLERTNRIYELEAIEYEESDHEFLPLLYAVIGLGYIFSRTEHQKHNCRRSVSQG